MATRGGAHEAPNTTELRLAARRAIAALRKAPRATAERALAPGENDENEENTPALEQLALYHLRQIAVELEDEVRSYLSTGRVRPSGVVSFLLSEGKDEGSRREETLEELMEMERVAATQRSGALRALEQQQPRRLPRPHPRPHPRAAADADARLNETFVVGEDGAAPAALAIPRIADFDGIREYSENVSARDNRPPFPAAGKRVIIVEEEDMGNPWATADGEEEVVRISGRDEAMDDDQVARVVKELRSELVADRSFVATFRSGDMASTAREIERRLRQRRGGEESSFDIEPSRAEDEAEEEEEARRDQRSKDQRSASRSAPKPHSMLPLLESTPLKARRQGMSQSHADTGSARRRILEKSPELVTIGVGTSARDAPGGYGSQDRLHHQLHSTGVQCELEDPSTMSSSHSPGVVPTISSDESTSFGQVPERLLRQLQQLQPKDAPRAAYREPPTMPSSVSSPDTLMLQLLQAAEPTPPTAAPRTTAPRADARFRAPDSIVSSSSAARSDAPSPDSLERWLQEQQRETEPRAAPLPPPPRRSRMYPSSSEEQNREDDEADNTLENLDSIREE